MADGVFAGGWLDETGRIRLVPLPTDQADRLGLTLSGIDPWLSHGYAAQALATYLATQEAQAPRLGLFVDDRLAGCAGVRLNWLRGPYLQLLAIVPEFQGRGLGSRVLAWLEQTARSHDEQNLWVAASDFNAGALRLYERAGFTRVADLDGLVSEGRAEVLLRKRLR